MTVNVSCRIDAADRLVTLSSDLESGRDVEVEPESRVSSPALRFMVSAKKNVRLEQ